MAIPQLQPPTEPDQTPASDGTGAETVARPGNVPPPAALVAPPPAAPRVPIHKEDPNKQIQLGIKEADEPDKIDATITEACAHAGISRQACYDQLEHDPGFADRMECAQLLVTP